MNIMVPVSSADKIGKLCAAGADELYVGIYDENGTGHLEIMKKLIGCLHLERKQMLK